jgi:hypothetical protein
VATVLLLALNGTHHTGDSRITGSRAASGLSASNRKNSPRAVPAETNLSSGLILASKISPDACRLHCISGTGFSKFHH